MVTKGKVNEWEQDYLGGVNVKVNYMMPSLDAVNSWMFSGITLHDMMIMLLSALSVSEPQNIFYRTLKRYIG